MHQVQRILVGVDVSEETFEVSDASKDAVNRALWLAKACRAELTLLTILSSPPVETTALMESKENPLLPLDQVKKRHQAMVAEAEAEGIKVESQVSHGRAWLEIVRTVLKTQPDLVVIGMTPRGTNRNMVLGSNAIKVLRKCPRPVWVTHPSAFRGETSTVIAADDLEAVGEKVLSIGVAAAQMTNSRLLILHSASYPLQGGLIRCETPQEEIDAYRQKVRDDAEVALRDRLTKHDYRTVSGGTQILVESGRPESAIVEIVKNENADLLVMGTVGRGGIPGFIIGNTAERVLAEIECSILAVKPDDFVCPVTVE